MRLDGRMGLQEIQEKLFLSPSATCTGLGPCPEQNSGLGSGAACLGGVRGLKP